MLSLLTNELPVLSIEIGIEPPTSPYGAFCQIDMHGYKCMQALLTYVMYTIPPPPPSTAEILDLHIHCLH